MKKFRTWEFTMKKYLLFYLIILPYILFSNLPDQQTTPSDMLLFSEHSIGRTQANSEQNENDNEEEITEELSDASPEYPVENCIPLS